jgi:hypothetical protein
MQENPERPRIADQLGLKNDAGTVDYKEVFERGFDRFSGAARRSGTSVILPTEWIEFAVQLYLKELHKFVAFPFTDRRYLKQIINSSAKNIIFLFGRQCEKSTSLGNICLTHCCLIPSIHVLYVAPTAPQTKVFSRDRLAEPVEISPKLKQFTSKHLPWNIFEKTFINQAKIILRYSYLTADRIRGIAADILMLDEVQDILTDNIPIMEECLSHANEAHRRKYFAGTPKAAEGSLGFYWDRSTRAEWAIPCDRHKPRYWNILHESNIGLEGLICAKCGKRINPYHDDAQWVRTNEGEYEFEGYRVPQIMVPIHQGEDEWKILLDKREKYSPSQFYNEVLALFSAAGDKPITEAELKRCCKSEINITEKESVEKYKRLAAMYEVFAGIDWGTGTQSYTVLFLASYFGGDRLKVFYCKRFIGQEADPVYQLTEIIKILQEYKVNVAGVDWGFGHVQNTRIAQDLVGECHVAKCYYAANPKHKIYLNPGVDRFTLHRTEMMAGMFNILKMDAIDLPRWADFKPFAADFLSIISDYNVNLRMTVYDHPPTKPDDSFHALLYCTVASFILFPREDLLGMPSIPQISD